jgi:hypothetical protein
MISIQIFKQLSLPKFPVMRSIGRNVQEWIRKEIVDDDPYEQETFLPENNKS